MADQGKEPVLHNEALEEAIKVFRDIKTTQIIPQRIYDKLVETGEWDEWTEDLKGEDKVKSQRARIEIQKYVVSIPYSIKDKFIILILDNMNLYRVCLPYEFDEETGKGRGLLRELEKEKEENFYFDD